MPSRTGKNRLLKLADMLEEDAKNRKGIKFDLDVVAKKSDGDEFLPEEVPTVSCGTTACAVGLACVSGAFKRSGLTYRIDGFGLMPFLDKSETISGWKAVDVFFDLTERESSFLFIPEYYPFDKRTGAKGERYVAKRIRNFVAGKFTQDEIEAW
jgi:hypothetical protein